MLKMLTKIISQHGNFKLVSTFGLPRVHHAFVVNWLSLRNSDNDTAFHTAVSELSICGRILRSNGRASRRGLKLLLSSLVGVDSCRHHCQCQCNNEQRSSQMVTYHIITTPHFTFKTTVPYFMSA